MRRSKRQRGDRNLEAYARRNRTLLELGFRSYQDYLRSDLWQAIRLRILGGWQRECRCGKTAFEVHHTSYSRAVLLGEDQSGLLPVCRECHQRAEYSGCRKRPLAKVNAILRKYP